MTDGIHEEIEQESIARRSLHDEVAGRIRAAIVEGRLPPEERLNERVLCKRYGISRTPLREALKVLASEGLVILHPNRGASVPPLTVEDLDSTVAVMSHIEILVGKLAAERITEDGLEKVVSLHHRMARHRSLGELPLYFQANQTIHSELVRHTRNPALESVYASLNARMLRFRYLANQSDDRWKEAMHEHELILEALLARDGARLGHLLHDHLLNKAEAVRDFIVSEKSIAASETHTGSFERNLLRNF